MKAEELINQVEEKKKDNWANSDLWLICQENLETIAAHLAECQECRVDFDAAEYQEATLQEMDQRYCFDDVSEWIC